MTRLYARAPGGARVHEGAPEGDWKILTIWGAISTRGMIATMTVEAATDGEIFLAYLDHVLCPALPPGDVVVMDNLSSHKVDGVRQRIEACRAELLYLPPYSPDLNPLEKAGPSSNSSFAQPRPAPPRRSNKPSPNCFQSYRPQMPKLGSVSAFMGYS